MKKTKNYAMPYPEQDDYFNVEDFQDMMVSVDDLMKKLSDSGAQISSDAEHLYNQTKAQMDNIQKRMNAFTALKEGSTTGDAELTDIRVAYDGREYGNAGEAVREQASDIHKALFGAGASIWSKAKSESTKYVAETKGICILNERFTAAGVVAKISRGTFAQNESTLNLDRECSAYIVEFEKNPGTVYMPSAETIKIVSTTKIIFEANGNARCWIPVEKGQYLAIDSTATAYTCESNHVPYMLYDQANKTLEYRGFGSTGSIEPVDLYSLALEYKLEYDMDDTGLVKQINANREAAASLKEDIGEQTFYQKQNNDSNIINGINGVGSITADKDCVIITSNKNLAIVTNSFSTDIQYGSPIQIDRRNIKAGKRYYISFDTENTGCQCLTCFDNKNVKKFTCDGTRKQFDILCSEHNSNKKSPLIQVTVGGVQSGLFTNVQIEEEKFTSYVEHKGEELVVSTNTNIEFNVYKNYTSIWCSDDSANIKITYPINSVHYIDEKVANIVSKLDNVKEDLNEQKFYKKQEITDNILLGNDSNGTIVADKNCTVITSNKNLAIVTNSFSTDIQYGSPIQIDRRNIKAGKRYYISFDTENTGCQCLTCFDNKNVKKFTCDGTRKQFDILCSEHNSNKKSPLIQVTVGGVQSGLFTNVQIEEEKFTSYVEHKGEEINLNANIIKNFSIYAGYTSVWCSDDSANIEITYQVNGVHYIDEKVANIVSKLDYIDGKVANIVSKFPNLKGKKVVTYGDSLFASGNDTNDYSWQKIVCESLGIENHIGVSIGGSGFCWNPNRRYTYPSNFVLGDNLPVGCFISSNGKRNANFCSWDRISKTIPKDADIVIVGTGTNDIGSFSTDLTFRTTNIQDTDWIASGEYSKYGGDFNTGGVRGAIMSTIMKIHCQAPNADIYLTNWCNSRGDNGTNNQTNTSRETETMAMLEDMEYASKNAGVPLFDLFHNSGINPLNRSDYVIDIIHLNTKGYKKMGNAIACAIKSLIN